MCPAMMSQGDGDDVVTLAFNRRKNFTELKQKLYSTYSIVSLDIF